MQSDHPRIVVIALKTLPGVPGYYCEMQSRCKNKD